MKRIVIITCYFGELPWYFQYFLHSCSYNTSIDFFIITDDCTYYHNHPANVQFIYKTLEDINEIVTKRIGFAVSIEYGYKFCDFKPAYGFLFPELIETYDFWGHCDVDVIYGNIRNFITDNLMTEHDLISVRPDWIPGCFLLFKNNEKVNTLFMQSKDYRKVFSSSQHFCFDETNFAHSEFAEGKKYYEIPTEIESMMHVVQRLEEAGLIKIYFDLHIVEGMPGKLKWDNGTLTYQRIYEALLYHMIWFKRSYDPKKLPKKIPNKFYISPTRIYV